MSDARTVPVTFTRMRMEIPSERDSLTVIAYDEAGGEQRLAMPMEAVSKVVTDVLSVVNHAHLDLPPRYGPGDTPPPHQNTIVLPRAVALNSSEAFPVLVFDFGGARLNVGVDVDALRRIFTVMNDFYPPEPAI